MAEDRRPPLRIARTLESSTRPRPPYVRYLQLAAGRYDRACSAGSLTPRGGQPGGGERPPRGGTVRWTCASSPLSRGALPLATWARKRRRGADSSAGRRPGERLRQELGRAGRPSRALRPRPPPWRRRRPIGRPERAARDYIGAAHALELAVRPTPDSRQPWRGSARPTRASDITTKPWPLPNAPPQPLSRRKQGCNTESAPGWRCCEVTRPRPRRVMPGWPSATPPTRRFCSTSPPPRGRRARSPRPWRPCRRPRPSTGTISRLVPVAETFDGRCDPCRPDTCRPSPSTTVPQLQAGDALNAMGVAYHDLGQYPPAIEILDGGPMKRRLGDNAGSPEPQNGPL